MDADAVGLRRKPSVIAHDWRTDSADLKREPEMSFGAAAVGSILERQGATVGFRDLTAEDEADA